MRLAVPPPIAAAALAIPGLSVHSHIKRIVVSSDSLDGLAALSALEAKANFAASDAAARAADRQATSARRESERYLTVGRERLGNFLNLHTIDGLDTVDARYELDLYNRPVQRYEQEQVAEA